MRKVLFGNSLAMVAWLIFSSSMVHGQYYNRGQDPASIRWMQIITPHFQLIFPEDFHVQATYLADILDYSYQYGGRTLGHHPRRVPVIVHNHTVESNGFVSWAPARMELFTTPPQDNDTYGWLERLAIHEFRHVVQVDKMNQGVTGVLSKVFGEHITGLAFGLFIPPWLFEGDAVAVETALTHSGRGRLPVFEQGLRAQLLERGAYSFDKALNGSFKDHVPNHYELGYQMVAVSRSLYGKDLWDKAMTNAARKPHTIVPLVSALRRYAGVDRQGLYRNTMEMLDSAWRKQYNKHTYTPFDTITPGKRLFTNYRYPVRVTDSAVVAYKTGLGNIPALVKVDIEGNESRLFTPGFINPYAFSGNGEVLVWSEHRNDPRWAHRSWSEIWRYDFHNGEKRRLTSRTRYFAPAISPDGRKVAAAEVTIQNQFAIAILDAESGELLRRFSMPDNDFLMTPSWHDNNSDIVMVAQGDSGKRLVIAGRGENGYHTVFDAGHTDISAPRFVSDSTIVFNGTFSGIDNIYSLDLSTGMVRQVVSSAFGARDAAIIGDGSLLVWSDYSSDGYSLAVAPLDVSGGIPIDSVADHSLKLHARLAAQEDMVIAREKVPREERHAIPYRKASHLFHFHSWAPVSLDVDNMEGNPGVSFMSQNALSSAFATAGYEFDINESLGKYYFDFRYEGLYPVLAFRASTGLRRSFYRDSRQERVSFLWRENAFRVGASIPLRHQRGPWHMGLRPSLFSSITRVSTTRDSPSFFRPNDIVSLEYGILAFQQFRTVARDIRPRWGAAVELNYRHTPFSGGDMGSIFSSRLVTLFPGIMPHHSLRLTSSFQQRLRGTPAEQTINYSFSNQVIYPRGIIGRVDDQAFIGQADYAFPLCYPDWAVSSLLYIKRFTFNMFADYARVRYSEEPEEGRVQRSFEENLYSVGADLIGQLHLLRAFPPIDLGVRVMRPSDQNSLQFQLLWSVGL